MPKVKLTKSKIDSIKFTQKGQVIYWDEETKGLGLVVGMTAKTFRLQIDVKDATRKSGYRTVKKTLGRYGEITPEQAKAMLTGYVDRETGEAVMGERLKLKIDKPSANIGKDKTLKQLITEYYTLTKRRDGKDRKESTATYYMRLLDRHYAAWVEMLLPEISAITPDAVLTKYAENEKQFGRQTTRGGAAVLSGILRYGMATYPAALPLNPMEILSNPYVNVRAERKARHDCLTYDPHKKRNDFPVFLAGIQKCTPQVRDGFLFTLFTGMRRAEVENLKWQDVSIEHRELTVKDTKNRTDLHIPLNRQAVEIITRRQSAVINDYVFPVARTGSKNPTGHVQLNALALKNKTGLDITVHGLRRTFTTIGRKLKRFEDTSRLTNHVDSSVEGKHYDRTGIEDLRETCQMIADTIERYMLESDSNVIQFPGMAKAA